MATGTSTAKAIRRVPLLRTTRSSSRTGGEVGYIHTYIYINIYIFISLFVYLFMYIDLFIWDTYIGKTDEPQDWVRGVPLCWAKRVWQLKQHHLRMGDKYLNQVEAKGELSMKQLGVFPILTGKTNGGLSPSFQKEGLTGETLGVCCTFFLSFAIFMGISCLTMFDQCDVKEYTDYTTYPLVN